MTYRISGCHGSVTVDELGIVLSRESGLDGDFDEDDNAGYPEVVRADWTEYVRYAGKKEDTDVLLIGFWLKDGSYEPPEHDARISCVSDGGYPLNEYAWLAAFHALYEDDAGHRFPGPDAEPLTAYGADIPPDAAVRLALSGDLEPAGTTTEVL